MGGSVIKCLDYLCPGDGAHIKPRPIENGPHFYTTLSRATIFRLFGSVPVVECGGGVLALPKRLVM